MNITVTSTGPEILEQGGHILKWNFKERKYETLSLDPQLVLNAEMSADVPCANCKTLTPYDETYSSCQWHTPHGIGYPVCETCSADEWKLRAQFPFN